jgi:hypothetical protein
MLHCNSQGRLSLGVPRKRLDRLGFCHFRTAVHPASKIWHDGTHVLTRLVRVQDETEPHLHAFIACLRAKVTAKSHATMHQNMTHPPIIQQASASNLKR